MLNTGASFCPDDAHSCIHHSLQCPWQTAAQNGSTHGGHKPLRHGLKQGLHFSGSHLGVKGRVLDHAVDEDGEVVLDHERLHVGLLALVHLLSE